MFVTDGQPVIRDIRIGLCDRHSAQTHILYCRSLIFRSDMSSTTYCFVTDLQILATSFI